ncbi:hypothetical protein CAPTEDRAFT_165770 [Capitella teleta]|uniref:Wnt inhibitory factor 1 n=1 Tax=Capitella teleta TaxID=283909 RepID=R7VGI2_CAPTE|nr:hypothetical protein CAPTEDRAFT_165770 [Capitella teleta]|eukprot:ELU17704.1 hypothetical protein CAPTEDRAFT_165770 [Capitella teleta]
MWRPLVFICVIIVPKIVNGAKKHDDFGNRLALWIDGKEVDKFAGVEMDIFIIRDGRVAAYLRDSHLDAGLPILPMNVEIVQLTWAAPDDLYTYEFTDLRSQDPHTMFDPLLSIPQKGYVPNKKTTFKMNLPCTGKLTGSASMYIALQIHNSRGAKVPGCPLRIQLRKQCIADENQRICAHTCANGGKCNQNGLCACAKGYYGDRCQLAACFPECINNGTCIQPGICQCSEGYVGRFCERAICSKMCFHGGACVAPDLCECTAGFYGETCEQRSGSCRIPCKNGGTCTEHDLCRCREGYVGQFCQKPICKRSCGVNGRCVDFNQCECYRGWRGRHCNKTVRRIHHSKDGKTRKKRKKDRRNRRGAAQRRSKHSRSIQKLQWYHTI